MSSKNEGRGHCLIGHKFKYVCVCRYLKKIEVVKGKGRREREGGGEIHSEYIYYCCKGNRYVHCYEGS